MKSTSLKKNFRRMAALLLAVAMVGLLPMQASVVNAETVDGIEYESLNNQANSSGVVTNMVSGESLSTGNNNADLHVTLNQDSDVVYAYKIADITWNSSTSKYTGPEWCSIVNSWLESKGYLASSNNGAYETPSALAAASSTTWNEFYQIMAKDETLLSNLENDTTGTRKFSQTGGTATDSDGVYVTFENMTFGCYLLVSATTNPAVANIIPAQTAAGYTIEKTITASLKDRTAKVDKYINDKKDTTVQVGDTVNYRVEIQLPKFEADKTVTLTDVMSNAFKLTENNGGLAFVYEYKDTDNAEHELTLVKDTDYTVTVNESATVSGSTVTKTDVTFVSSSIVSKATNDNGGTMYMTYTATVTSNIKYNSELNTNTATVTVNSKTYSDTTKAYTYALNVVKLDGSTDDDPSKMSYLAGAQFALFREAYTYENDTWKSNYDDEFYNTYEAEDLDTTEGSADNPYTISSQADLQKIGTTYPAGKTYEVTADFTIDSTWTSISELAGVLNGNNHTITITDQTAPLFTTIASAGKVMGLNLVSTNSSCSILADTLDGGTINKVKVDSTSNITSSESYEHVGGLVTLINAGTISNCENGATITVTASDTYAGGLVGECAGETANTYTYTISNCINNGNVTSKTCAAGIIGNCLGSSTNVGTITGCVNNGDITAPDSSASAGGITAQAKYVTITDCANNGNISTQNVYPYNGGKSGGIAASMYIYANESLSNCVNNGDVSATSYAGGIIGYASHELSSETDYISNCYNYGTVTIRSTDSNAAGGIIGKLNDSKKVGVLTYCYNAGAVNGPKQVGGIAGYLDGASAQYCYNTGAISSNKTLGSETLSDTYYIGGIVGYSSTDSTYDNCYSSGNIYPSSNTVTTGIPTAEANQDSIAVGYIVGSANSNITNCATTIPSGTKMATSDAATACAVTYSDDKFIITIVFTITASDTGKKARNSGAPSVTLATMEADTTNYYVLTTTEGSVTTKRVFKLVVLGSGTNDFKGTFTSVATAEGVTVNGLNAGNYVLMETKAPTGYNDLSEDIYFEINRMTQADADLKTNGSLNAFYEMGETTTLNETGRIDLQVINYKGLTLPSTGGMGTLLFTIIGCIIMVAAMVFISLKNRKRTANDFM